MKHVYTILPAILIFTLSSFAQIPTNGLVAWYPFDGDAADASNHGNDGTTNSGVIWVSDRLGQASSAASFDSTGVIIVPLSDSLQVQYDITVCAWVRCAFPQPGGGIVERYYDGTDDHGWLLNTYPDGKALMEGRDGRGGDNTLKSGPSGNFSDNNWHFLVGQRSGNIWKIYLDVVLSSSNDVGASSGSGSIESNGNLRIGAVRDSPTNFWKGQIDDIRIYNRALSEAEIGQLYNENGYTTGPFNLTLRDGSNTHEFIASKEFNFYKVNKVGADFNESFKGALTTDVQGKVTIPSGWFQIYDTIKIDKIVNVKKTTRHVAVDDTEYVLKIDNAKFNLDGSMHYRKLFGIPNEADTIDHSTFMYDLVISMEWDANHEYISSLVNGFRYGSNYLYDVSDGQVMIRRILVFDNKLHWSDADINIYADNSLKPGTYRNRRYSLFPRIWDEEPVSTITASWKNYPYDLTKSNDYRSKMHELGHLLLGFYDEYWNKKHDKVHESYNFGYMDCQYEDCQTVGEGEPEYASEMSSFKRYKELSYRDTEQWVKFSMSCWDYFESQNEKTINGLFIPIIKPEERGTVSYFAGPNDNMNSLDIDVGKRMIATAFDALSGGNDYLAMIVDKNRNR